MTTPNLIGVRNAARQLGVHENTVRRWEESGVLRAVRLPSGVRRFRADDIRELQESMFGTSDGREAAVAAAANRAENSREVA